MKLSISVMAHPSRERCFPYLKERLGDVPFSIDDGRGLWENCKAAWKLHDPTADYHVVIQDDAVICDNFIEKAMQMIDRPGEFAYSFYWGHRYRASFQPRNRSGIEKGFIIDSMPHWGIALCIPTKYIDEMIEFCDKLTGIPQADERIARFLIHKKISVYFPIPSLIDHRWWEHSLVGNKGSKRKALKFIDGEVEFNQETGEIK